MIVCTKCGLQNDPADSFCGSCGSFLEWTGTKVEEPAPVLGLPVAAEPSPAPEQPGFIGRVRDAVGLGGHAAGPAADADDAAVADVATRRDAETAAADAAAGGTTAAPIPVVVSGPKVFRIVDATPEPAPAPAPIEPDPEPAPEQEPEPAPAPGPAPEPAPAPAAPPERLPAEPTPEPEPAPAAPPERLPAEPTPEPEPAPAAPPERLPAEPTPEPEPAPAAPPERLPAEPAPEPAPAPAPEPAPSPEPAPAGASCPACGRANPSGRVFCASCGERLPVAPGAGAPTPPSGTPPVPPPPDPGEPRVRPMLPGAAATPTPRVLVQPSRPAEPPPPAAAASIDRAPAPPVAAPTLAAPAQPPAQRPGKAQPPARLPSMPAAAAAAAAGAALPQAAGPAAAPVAPLTPAPPVPADQPAARRPEAAKPGPERPRPASRPAQEVTPAPNPGDLVCANCGIGNDPARRFCRRCGQSLAAASVAQRVPWYRRIFGGGPRAKVAAGERPKSMRTDGKTGGGIKVGRLLSVGFQVVMLAGVSGIVTGYALVPSWRDAVNGFINSVKEVIVPSADQVYTSGPTTGPGTREHPARLAFDRTLAFWAAPFADGSPPTIEGSFSPPATMAKILVTAGAAGDQYKAFARPRDVTFEFLDASGTVIASRSYELKDQADPQPFDVGAKGASRVRLTVRSVFPAEKPNAPVAVSEVEFFGSQEGSPTPAP